MRHTNHGPATSYFQRDSSFIFGVEIHLLLVSGDWQKSWSGKPGLVLKGEGDASSLGFWKGIMELQIEIGLKGVKSEWGPFKCCKVSFFLLPNRSVGCPVEVSDNTLNLHWCSKHCPGISDRNRWCTKIFLCCPEMMHNDLCATPLVLIRKVCVNLV